jgi:hypothetical protein
LIEIQDVELFRLHRESGTAPMKAFVARLISINDESFPSSDGTEPTSEFMYKSRSVSAVSPPTDVESEPVRAL